MLTKNTWLSFDKIKGYIKQLKGNLKMQCDIILETQV